MLRLAILFLVIALIAGALGLGGVAVLSMEAARLLFFIFVVFAVVFLVAGIHRRVAHLSFLIGSRHCLTPFP